MSPTVVNAHPASRRPFGPLALAASFAIAVLASGSAAMASQPLQSTGAGHGAISRAMHWDLEFRPGDLRLYTDAVEGKSYWYFTYKVVNRTGQDRMWAPRFEFFSDKGAIVTSGREIPSRVTDAVLCLLGNPLLQDQNQIIGQILVGEEHAKEGVVLWQADDAEVTEFTVFVTGASGRARKVPAPKTGELRVERWTIRFNYLVPGNALERGSRPVAPTVAEDDLKAGAERRTDWGVWLWR